MPGYTGVFVCFMVLVIRTGTFASQPNADRYVQRLDEDKAPSPGSRNESTQLSFLFHSRHVYRTFHQRKSFWTGGTDFQDSGFRKSVSYNGTKVEIGDRDILLGAGFSTFKLTKIIIHGWMQNGSDEFTTMLTNALLDKYDVNVLSMNWTEFAFLPYPESVNKVPYVGAYAASFIDFLVRDVGVHLSTIHVVAHSLGAQIAGAAAEKVASGKLPRISGLDPAGPLFIGTGPQGRLDASDARCVDVIHTAAGSYGYADPCGTVDFYPNGGSIPQPGCEGQTEPSCSHHRSYFFYAESVASYGFVATQCDDWSDYLVGDCDDNRRAVMGYHVDERTRGVYYLSTNAESPFAQS